jgi:hypothetical protein
MPYAPQGVKGSDDDAVLLDLIPFLTIKFRAINAANTMLHIPRLLTLHSLMITSCTSTFNIQNFTFPAECICMFEWISEQTATIYLLSTN